ncbi:MAG TPA: FkbM family methyltransferase [Nitrospina sp.]|nr:FkbM family methyltransferase [Nitrospina sp.]
MSRHSIKSFSSALFKKSFYLAFVNIFLYFKSPLKVLIRYVFEVGNYPQVFFIRTPLGVQSATSFSHHDLITLIECFGKLDYRASEDISVVVDFGSNIGLSALYFLTRNRNVKVYMFEPVPSNIQRLRKNLIGFEKRYELKECAVGVEEGRFGFALDETGRYGGLVKGGPLHFSQWDPKKIVSVDVVSVNESLIEILKSHKSLDILKIDVEGYENKILGHLKKEIISRIDHIYAETADGQKIPGFSSKSKNGLTSYCRI